MSYIKSSTDNPYGFRPYQALLRPGGLGAFFPNAQAIGTPSVMIDKDSVNPGAPIPRVYYPPDARLQYSVPRRQGLGAAAPLPITAFYPHNTLVYARPSIWGSLQNANPTDATPTAMTPTVPSPQTPPNWGWRGGGGTWGNRSYQSTGTAAGTPVPANWPKNQSYTDPSGNVWTYNGSSGTWNIQVQQNYSASVPAGWPTNQPYIDSSGNTWTWSGSGGWQITTYAETAAAATTTAVATSAAPSWFTDPTQEVISGLPNWGLVGGVGLAVLLLMRRK